MPRLAREVAAMTGKLVRLTSEGEATEVDKTVIEHVADPLTHMIQNTNSLKRRSLSAAPVAAQRCRRCDAEGLVDSASTANCAASGGHRRR